MVSSSRRLKITIWFLYSAGIVVVLWARRVSQRLLDFSDVDDFARLLSRQGTHLSDSSSHLLAEQLLAVKSFDKDRLWPFNNSRDVKGYLIHIGKAGGSSLQVRLNVRESIPILPCRMNSTNQQEEAGCTKKKGASILKQRLFGSFHTFSSRYTPEQKRWLRNNTNLLVFTVRDPVDRVVSAFNFHRHNYLNGKDKRPITKKGRRKLGYQIYFECFSTVEDLAMAASDSLLPAGTSNSCRQLAHKLLGGTVEPTVCPHLYWNYKYYGRALQWGNKTKTVAVIRTESLWYDVARLEYLLGGDPVQFLKPEKQVQYTHGSEVFQVKDGVSAKGARSLCCNLRKELSVYHNLIAVAANLGTNEKVRTIRSLMRHCGIVMPDGEPHDVLAWRWNDWVC